MADDELVELECPEPGCEFRAVGKAKGSGAASWKLGTHRSRAHGYRSGASKARAKRTASTSADTPTAVQVVRDIASELDAGGAKSEKPPSVDEWERALGRGLFTLSVTAASWLVESDPTIPDDRTREAVADYLSLKPAAARETMRPVAKLVGRSKVNARIGRAVVDNVDVVSSGSELALLFLRYRRYFRQRNALMTSQLPTVTGVNGQPWQPPQQPVAVHPEDQAMAPVPVGVGTVIDPGQQQGFVVDAAMVAQMRAQQRGSNGHA